MKIKRIKNINGKNKLLRLVSSYSNKNNRIIFIILVAISCLIFSILFLFEPAKQYYKSVREHDKLMVQYNSLVAANEELSNQIKNLQTPEGIKQAATEKLGLVQNGEMSAHVSGLNIDKENDESSWENSPKSTWKNAKYPKTWYSDFLDAIFKVQN